MEGRMEGKQTKGRRRVGIFDDHPHSPSYMNRGIHI